MIKIDVVNEHHRMGMRIGIEKPVADFTGDFFVPGKIRNGHPRISTTPAFDAFEVPAHLPEGSSVPILSMRRSYAHFDVATWGRFDAERSEPTMFMPVGQSIGFPSLISANYIDIAWDDGSNVTVLRLHATRPHLYVGCMGYLAGSDTVASVVPLVCEAGRDIAPHMPWQPLLIEIGGTPTNENFDFLMRRDRRVLQRSSLPGTVRVEVREVVAGKRDAGARTA